MLRTTQRARGGECEHVNRKKDINQPNTHPCVFRQNGFLGLATQICPTAKSTPSPSPHENFHARIPILTRKMYAVWWPSFGLYSTCSTQREVLLTACCKMRNISHCCTLVRGFNLPHGTRCLDRLIACKWGNQALYRAGSLSVHTATPVATSSAKWIHRRL